MALIDLALQYPPALAPIENLQVNVLQAVFYSRFFGSLLRQHFGKWDGPI